MKKPFPSKLYIDNLLRYCDCNADRHRAKDGSEEWVPERPIGFLTRKERFAAARDVFLGKADALYWRDIPPNAGGER